MGREVPRRRSNAVYRIVRYQEEHPGTTRKELASALGVGSQMILHALGRHNKVYKRRNTKVDGVTLTGTGSADYATVMSIRDGCLSADLRAVTDLLQGLAERVERIERVEEAIKSIGRS